MSSTKKRSLSYERDGAEHSHRGIVIGRVMLDIPFERLRLAEGDPNKVRSTVLIATHAEQLGGTVVPYR